MLNRRFIQDKPQIFAALIQFNIRKIGDEGLSKKKIRPTILDPYKEYIKIEANKGIQAKRIYHDLIRDYDYKGSYDTVKKYIHSIKEDNSKVYMVLNTQPGEEAQVDFGYIGFLNIRGHFH